MEKENLKQIKGITLISLVITIIVLLILAAVSIVLILMANEGAEENGNLVENLEDSGTIVPSTKKYIEDAKTVLSETENVVVEDEFGNSVTIPAGFKVSTDSGTDVTEGIVVEDSIGNQFVWVPLGTININNSGETKTIELSRYEFDSNGMATKKELTDDINSVESYNDYEYVEEQTSTKGNSVAKDLKDFITKTKDSSGYYIARYEASKGADGKVESKANQSAWVNITQPEAVIEAGKMYDSTKYTTDLINSLAWDTAIVYIQTFSDNSIYSMQKSLNTVEQNTGMSGDIECNIYDMASNVFEWSTETSTVIDNECVNRGGNYYYTMYPSSMRNRSSNSSSYSNAISFRSVLYL